MRRDFVAPCRAGPVYEVYDDSLRRRVGSEPKRKSRVQSVDALRGLVMIIMALDHTREFFHSYSMQFQPEDLAHTTAAIFFTRWITHICAPVFMLTAGVGAYFWASRGRSANELSGFLWKRGLWLVVLELTVLRFAMTFNFSGMVLLTVLWALGWSMVALGFLVHLPMRVLAVLSVAVIALHNLADPLTATQFGAAGWIWNVLHQQGVFHLGGVTFIAGYPLIPWFAVMAAGFCLGPLVALDPPRRRWWMERIGLGMTLAFLILRALNIYGDPRPWTRQIPGMTVLSFLNCAKYPPSLDFLLMTLGPALLMLAALDRIPLRETNPMIVFGRVPLFYFLVHFYVIHILASVFVHGDGTNAGYGLGIVYLVWAIVVLSMYPICLWFARLKERRRDWWLSYL